MLFSWSRLLTPASYATRKTTRTELILLSELPVVLAIGAVLRWAGRIYQLLIFPVMEVERLEMSSPPNNYNSASHKSVTT